MSGWSSLASRSNPWPHDILLACCKTIIFMHSLIFFTGKFTFSNEGAYSIGKGHAHLHPGVVAGLTKFGCGGAKNEHHLLAQILLL